MGSYDTRGGTPHHDPMFDHEPRRSTTEKTRRLLEAAEQDSKGLILPKSLRDLMRHARNVRPAYVRVAEVLAERGCTHPGYCEKGKWQCDTCLALADLEALEEAGDG